MNEKFVALIGCVFYMSYIIKLCLFDFFIVLLLIVGLYRQQLDLHSDRHKCFGLRVRSRIKRDQTAIQNLSGIAGNKWVAGSKLEVPIFRVSVGNFGKKPE